MTTEELLNSHKRDFQNQSRTIANGARTRSEALAQDTGRPLNDIERILGMRLDDETTAGRNRAKTQAQTQAANTGMSLDEILGLNEKILRGDAAYSQARAQPRTPAPLLPVPGTNGYFYGAGGLWRNGPPPQNPQGLNPVSAYSSHGMGPLY
jgi:hypothetical protein